MSILASSYSELSKYVLFHAIAQMEAAEEAPRYPCDS